MSEELLSAFNTVFVFIAFLVMAVVIAFYWHDLKEFFKGKPKPAKVRPLKPYEFYKKLFANAYEQKDRETMELANKKLNELEKGTGAIKGDIDIIDRIHLIKGIPLNKTVKSKQTIK